MKSIWLTIFLLLPFIAAAQTWYTDAEIAFEQAAKQEKYTLVYFSGSDWCTPCIQLKRSLLDHPSFTAFAQENLILLNLDFPRSRKRQPEATIMKEREALADQYNKEGSFPKLLLIDHQRNPVGVWSGLPYQQVENFIQSIKGKLPRTKEAETWK